MNQDENVNYTISLNNEPPLTYEDGFADGFSRAWQECWEYMINEINKAKTKEPEVKP